MSKVLLVCLIGPSGSGKSTIGSSLGIPVLKSITTRPKRESDTNDEYTYVTVEDFEERKAADHLVECVEYLGNFYGIDRRDLEKIISTNTPHYSPITIEGYRCLKENMPEGSVISVFVHAPFEQVTKRLDARGGSAADIEKRRANYAAEFNNITICDHIVFNHDGMLDRSIYSIKTLLKDCD